MNTASAPRTSATALIASQFIRFSFFVIPETAHSASDRFGSKAASHEFSSPVAALSRFVP
jgi:hypothetical protein